MLPTDSVVQKVGRQSGLIFRRWIWWYYHMYAKNLSLFPNGLSNKKEPRLISSQTPWTSKSWPVFDIHGVKSNKQIEFCGCIIAGVHGAFAAGSSILGILFDQNLNHLELHGKLMKIKKKLFKWYQKYENVFQIIFSILKSFSSLLSWQFKMTAGYFIRRVIRIW